MKRQDLARLVRSIRIVTYPVRHDVAPGRFRAAFHETFPELMHAEVNSSYLSPAEVAVALNEAQVQLALSAAEGCMYALTEGLLCGVPAVSTPAFGGREQFFITPFVELADADPVAIAEAVQRMAAAPFGRARHRTQIPAELCVLYRVSLRLPRFTDVGAYVRSPARPRSVVLPPRPRSAR